MPRAVAFVVSLLIVTVSFVAFGAGPFSLAQNAAACPIPVIPPPAHPSPQCGSPPPCQPSSVTLTFRIYQGDGQVNFNGGGPYHNGDSVTVQGGCGEAYSISEVSNSVPSGFAFWQWVSDAGTFGDKTAASTNFTPGPSSGTISMVLTQTQDHNWGGYLVATTQAITSVSGTFYLPTRAAFLGYTTYNSTDDVVSIWVGIGGAEGLGFTSTLNAFSQAGIDIDTHYDNTTSFTAWYQYWSVYYGLGSGTVHDVEAPGSFTSTIHRGDEIRVTVWFTGSGIGANNYWKIEDLSRGTTWAPLPWQNYPPDSRAGEWILEDPGCVWLGSLIPQCWVMPTMTKTVFATLSNNIYSGLAAPTLRLGEHDQFPDGCGYPFDQYLHPDYVYGTQSFSVPEQETTWSTCNTYGP